MNGLWNISKHSSLPVRLSASLDEIGIVILVAETRVCGTCFNQMLWNNLRMAHTASDQRCLFYRQNAGTGSD